MGLWRFPQAVFFTWKEACTLETLVTGTSSMANLESCTQDVSFPTPLPNSFTDKNSLTHGVISHVKPQPPMPWVSAAFQDCCTEMAMSGVGTSFCPWNSSNNFEISPLPQIRSWHIKIDKCVRKGMLNWYVTLQPCVLTFPSSWDCWHENAIFTLGSSLMQGLCIGSPDDCHNIHCWT